MSDTMSGKAGKGRGEARPDVVFHRLTLRPVDSTIGLKPMVFGPGATTIGHASEDGSDFCIPYISTLPGVFSGNSRVSRKHVRILFDGNSEGGEGVWYCQNEGRNGSIINKTFVFDSNKIIKLNDGDVIGLAPFKNGHDMECRQCTCEFIPKKDDAGMIVGLVRKLNAECEVIPQILKHGQRLEMHFEESKTGYTPYQYNVVIEKIINREFPQKSNDDAEESDEPSSPILLRGSGSPKSSGGAASQKGKTSLLQDSLDASELERKKLEDRLDASELERKELQEELERLRTVNAELVGDSNTRKRRRIPQPDLSDKPGMSVRFDDPA